MVLVKVGQAVVHKDRVLQLDRNINLHGALCHRPRHLVGGSNSLNSLEFWCVSIAGCAREVDSVRILGDGRKVGRSLVALGIVNHNLGDLEL